MCERYTKRISFLYCCDVIEMIFRTNIIKIERGQSLVNIFLRLWTHRHRVIFIPVKCGSFLTDRLQYYTITVNCRLYDLLHSKSVRRSLKFILSSFYFSIISKLFSTIVIIVMIINCFFLPKYLYLPTHIIFSMCSCIVPTHFLYLNPVV